MRIWNIRNATRTLTFASVLGLTSITAWADGGECDLNFVSTIEQIHYQGYSANTADESGGGTSTVLVSTYESEKVCDGTIVGTQTTTFYNYVDGPGASDYDQYDYETCEATGELLC